MWLASLFLSFASFASFASFSAWSSKVGLPWWSRDPMWSHVIPWSVLEGTKVVCSGRPKHLGLALGYHWISLVSLVLWFLWGFIGHSNESWGVLMMNLFASYQILELLPVEMRIIQSVQTPLSVHTSICEYSQYFPTYFHLYAPGLQMNPNPHWKNTWKPHLQTFPDYFPRPPADLT